MIGFFDSGSGGLSVLSHFRRLAPAADAVYFGDIKNAPYGERSAEDLAALTIAGVEILRSHKAAAIVSACNSVSTSILAGASGDLPFVEMSMPTALFMKQYAGKKFLLIATPATIASGIYARALSGVVETEFLGVSELAGAIEFGESEEKIKDILTGALMLKKSAAYDGVILGCTHYPLALSMLSPVIEKECGTTLIIDPGLPVASEAAKRFSEEGSGKTTFLISKENEAFRKKVAEIFPDVEYSIEII
jgi:glutamate racemase